MISKTDILNAGGGLKSKALVLLGSALLVGSIARKGQSQNRPKDYQSNIPNTTSVYRQFKWLLSIAVPGKLLSILA